MSEQKKRPTVGLALGGGSARGFAHIGVIRALQENKIPVDVVSGCSMGDNHRRNLLRGGRLGVAVEDLHADDCPRDDGSCRSETWFGQGCKV